MTYRNHAKITFYSKTFPTPRCCSSNNTNKKEFNLTLLPFLVYLFFFQQKKRIFSRSKIIVTTRPTCLACDWLTVIMRRILGRLCEASNYIVTHSTSTTIKYKFASYALRNWLLHSLIKFPFNTHTHTKRQNEYTKNIKK